MGDPRGDQSGLARCNHVSKDKTNTTSWPSPVGEVSQAHRSRRLSDGGKLISFVCYFFSVCTANVRTASVYEQYLNSDLPIQRQNIRKHPLIMLLLWKDFRYLFFFLLVSQNQTFRLVSTHSACDTHIPHIEDAWCLIPERREEIIYMHKRLSDNTYWLQDWRRHKKSRVPPTFLWTDSWTVEWKQRKKKRKKKHKRGASKKSSDSHRPQFACNHTTVLVLTCCKAKERAANWQ